MLNGCYPSDFIHCILSAHCAYEKPKEGGNVEFCQKIFRTIVNLDEFELLESPYPGPLTKYNEYAKGWKVGLVISEGLYRGIVYQNEAAKQMMLAYSVTNSKWKFFDMILHNDTMEQKVSIDKVIEQSLNYVNLKSDFSFSITGYLLGAWPAELSIYQIRNERPNQDVKGVTFDGPNVSIQTIIDAKGSKNLKDLETLYITSHFSVPNFVNRAKFANKDSVQQLPVYTLYQSDDEYYKKRFPKFCYTVYSKHILSGIMNTSFGFLLTSRILDISSMLSAFDAAGNTKEYWHINELHKMAYKEANDKIGHENIVYSTMLGIFTGVS